MKYSLAGLICLVLGALNVHWQGSVEGSGYHGLVGNSILIGLGLVLILSSLGDALAARRAKPAPAEKAAAVPPVPLEADAEAVHFLSLLQRKGRLVDFLKDDITRYTDAQVGAAARVVHEGCAAVLKEYFDIVPVRADGEGRPVTLDKDFDPGKYRLVGKVAGQPPFRGTLLHQGWMTTKVTLPRVASPRAREIIAPAEVELT